MKKFITIISLLLAFTINAQNVTVIQFNAKWNSHNTNRSIERIKYKFAYLENQSEELQESIKAVPTVVVYKDGRPVGVFAGDLTMTLRVRIEDIQELVDKHID